MLDIKSVNTKLNTEVWEIERIHPAPYNPRIDLTPGDPDYERIRHSIETYGYVDPIIVNQNGNIIGGHQRFKVMKDLGAKEVQVVVLDLDEQREKGLNLILNRAVGRWDDEKLKDLLLELDASDFALEDTGFDEDDLKQLNICVGTDEIGLQEDDFDSDAAMDKITEPVTKPGDIWCLGEHRLMCGDTSNLEDVKILTGGGEGECSFY